MCSYVCVFAECVGVAGVWMRPLRFCPRSLRLPRLLGIRHGVLSWNDALGQLCVVVPISTLARLSLVAEESCGYLRSRR